jgi:hypothetical protein
MSASQKTPKETTMNTRILTIAAATAIAVTAFGFNAPASAAPLGLASQTIAQSSAQSLDSPVLQVSKKGGNKGKWGGHKGKWHGHKGHWGGHWGGHKKFYYGYAPTYHGGCYKQVQLLIGGYYAWHTINICN